MAFKSFPQEAFPDCSAHKALFSASQGVPPLLPHSSAWHTVGLQEDLLTHALTVATWFWAREQLAIPQFPRTGCKVVAGVNHPLHRNQGPGEPQGPQLPFWL